MNFPPFPPTTLEDYNIWLGWLGVFLSQLAPTIASTKLQYVSYDLAATLVNMTHLTILGSFAYATSQRVVVLRGLIVLYEEITQTKQKNVYMLTYLALAYLLCNRFYEFFINPCFDTMVNMFPGISMLISNYTLTLSIRSLRIGKVLAKPLTLAYHYHKGSGSSLFNSLMSFGSSMVGIFNFEIRPKLFPKGKEEKKIEGGKKGREKSKKDS